MPVLRRDSLWFGLAFLVLGITVGVFGWLRSSEPLAETTGVITQMSLASGEDGPGPRILHYRYTVGDGDYSGQGHVRYSALQDESLATGHAIPVFYKRSHPLVSYPLYPPSRLLWISGAIFLVAFGFRAIVWGWPR